MDWEIGMQLTEMLISVQLRVFYMSTYSHCVSSPAEAQFVSSICTSHNETHEDSHTGSRLACTNPSRASQSLMCGTRVLTRASNKSNNTCEKTIRVINLDVSLPYST